MTRDGISLMNKLIEQNLIMEIPEWRDPWYWTGGEPPPQKDPELGIGKDLAWQTPLHREAVRRTLKGED